MSPPSNDPQFLADMSRAVLGAMQAGDPQAVWVMQGWLFVNNPKFWQPPQAKALFDAVPNERMVVLDLYCEAAPVWDKTEAFHGKPWVWCIIHNYGGRVGLYGGLPQILNNLNTARTSPERGDLRGVGLIMEGFGYNPVVYDLLTDMIWRDEIPGLDTWLADFVLRRYGKRVETADQAWELLRRAVYQLPSYSGSVIFSRPSLQASQPIPYDTSQLASACDLLLSSAGDLGSVDTYQFDVVHVIRQVLGDLAQTMYMDVVDAYAARDREALRLAGQRYLELVRDIDRLLGTRREFLLGAWLRDAQRWATTDDERRLLEWNARNLITLWGPRDSVLHEYAYRQWSGIDSRILSETLGDVLRPACEVARDRQGFRCGGIRTGDPHVGRKLDPWHRVLSRLNRLEIPCSSARRSGPSTGMRFASRSLRTTSVSPQASPLHVLRRSRRTRRRWPTMAVRAIPVPSGQPMCKVTAIHGGKSIWKRRHRSAAWSSCRSTATSATTALRSRRPWMASPGRSLPTGGTINRRPREKATRASSNRAQRVSCASRCHTTRPTPAAISWKSWCTNVSADWPSTRGIGFQPVGQERQARCLSHFSCL